MKNKFLSTNIAYLVLFVLSFSLDFSVAAETKGLKVTRELSGKFKYRRRVALCIGINKYSNYKAEGKHCSDLKAAVSDAKRMAALFRNCGFNEVILLTGQEASRDNIIRKIERIKINSRNDDLFVFSYSGHGGGVMVGNSPHSYLIPFDCLAGQAVSNGISVDLLKDLALTMNNRHILFLLDCCYAGVLVADKPRKPDSMNLEEFQDFLKKRCIYALVASGVTETSTENPCCGGVFTDSVVKGLNGKADTNNDGIILVVKELTYAVMKALSEDVRIPQTPRGAKLAVGDGDIVLPVTGNVKKLPNIVPQTTADKSSKSIEKVYEEAVILEKANKIRQAQLLMTKVYIDYEELPENQKKTRELNKYLSMLINLTKRTFEQVSKSDSNESALLYYYSQKYLQLNPDPFQKACAYLNIGTYCNYRGEYEKAEFLLKKALKLFSQSKNRKDKRQRKIAECLRSLGIISMNLYKYETALQYFKQAIDFVGKQGEVIDPLERAKLCGAMGDAYIAAGNFGTAQEWLKRSLNEFKKNFVENDLGVAQVYNSLGVCAINVKDYHKALRCFKHAININKEIFGPDNKHNVVVYCNLGTVYLKKNELDKALKASQKARSIVRRYYSPGHPQIRFTDELLGRIYLTQQRYSTSEYFFKHNLRITEKCFANHPQTATAYEWLGLLYLRKHFWRRAKSFFKKAKVIRNEYLGSSHYQTLNTEHLLKQVEVEEEKLKNLGEKEKWKKLEKKKNGKKKD